MKEKSVKTISKAFFVLALVGCIFSLLAACDISIPVTSSAQVVIKGDSAVTLKVGESYQTEVEEGAGGKILWSSSDVSCVTVDENGRITAVSEGYATVVASCGGNADFLSVTVVKNEAEGSAGAGNGDGGNSDTGSTEGGNSGTEGGGSGTDGEDGSDTDGENGSDGGEAGSSGTGGSDTGADSDGGSDKPTEPVYTATTNSGVRDSGTPPTLSGNDPYANMTSIEFYQNYTPAKSYEDAYYRSLHGFMSGTIAPQDQKPTLSDRRPMLDGKYVKRADAIYSDNGNTYHMTDAYGNVVNTVYKGGAYIMLEEVAAYVYAFGDIPANHISKKSTSPSNSVWREYLRVNHTYFSGDTSSYPYEPELPNISGCGGVLQYYEMDIGTTGTDCDPSYKAAIYNNGTKITRGAARIVYGREDINSNGVYEENEIYLFYTYNHYNDFQEYLNYVGGWGEMFGNITGGGTISSKTHYNPTSYVRSVLATESSDTESASVCFVACICYGKRENVNIV